MYRGGAFHSKAPPKAGSISSHSPHMDQHIRKAFYVNSLQCSLTELFYYSAVVSRGISHNNPSNVKYLKPDNTYNTALN